MIPQQSLRAALSFILLSFANAGWGQISLQHGNLVVYRVGDGSTTLTGAGSQISLLEFTTTGTLVQTISVPGTGTDRLTSSGTATSEGKLRYNGRYLAITGYDADLGTPGLVGSTAATNPRRVVVYENNPLGTKQTTNISGAFNANNIRSAIPQGDGSGVWVTGHASNATNGVWYHNFTTSTTTQIVSSQNLRTTHIYNGQLYTGRASGGSEIQSVGTGLPITTTTLSNLPGTPTGQALFMADLAGGTVMYVTTDTGTLTKYSLVAGNWVSNGTSAAAGVGTMYDLTGYVDNSGNVRLFAVSETSLVAITDSNGWNASFGGTFSTLATAGTNYAFRGITYVPEPAILISLVLGVLLAGVFATRRRGLART